MRIDGHEVSGPVAMEASEAERSKRAGMAKGIYSKVANVAANMRAACAWPLRLLWPRLVRSGVIRVDL
jgi:hypothetical protein